MCPSLTRNETPCAARCLRVCITRVYTRGRTRARAVLNVYDI